MVKPYYVTSAALVPNQLTLNGSYWGEKEIKQVAYSMFKNAGSNVNPFRIVDVNHDNQIIDAIIVESYLAKKGDPEYIEGTWVVTVEISDQAIIDAIKANELNGFSIEFFRDFTNEFVYLAYVPLRVFETKESDGHVHLVELSFDPDTGVYYGQTSTNEGHSHSIFNTTITSLENGHTHRIDFN